MLFITIWLLVGWASAYVIWWCEKYWDQKYPSPIGIIVMAICGLAGPAMAFMAIPFVAVRTSEWIEDAGSWWTTPLFEKRGDE